MPGKTNLARSRVDLVSVLETASAMSGREEATDSEAEVRSSGGVFGGGDRRRERSVERGSGSERRGRRCRVLRRVEVFVVWARWVLSSWGEMGN